MQTAHQVHARALVVGQRMLPHVFVRAADARPLELQDLLPADTRFKILVFGGDIAVPADAAALRAAAAALARPDGFLRRFGRARDAEPGSWAAFDVLCFSSAKKDKVGYLGEC